MTGVLSLTRNRPYFQVSKKRGTSKGLSVAKNMKVGNLEKKMRIRNINHIFRRTVRYDKG
jgi:hypothetical protein|tara:strand:+ start:241 stop:420 length:180 start_codon:yes stop_codon:yes gene_type:complete